MSLTLKTVGYDLELTSNRKFWRKQKSKKVTISSRIIGKLIFNNKNNNGNTKNEVSRNKKFRKWKVYSKQNE